MSKYEVTVQQVHYYEGSIVVDADSEEEAIEAGINRCEEAALIKTNIEWDHYGASALEI